MEKAVSYLVNTISQGFLGLAPKHDMPVSGLSIPGDSPYKIPSDPMLASTDFMVHGIYLTHACIRTLHDPGALCSRYITMMLYLESKLLQTGIATSKHKNAPSKSSALRFLLKERMHADGEARWVFAVFNLSRIEYTRVWAGSAIICVISGVVAASLLINIYVLFVFHLLVIVHSYKCLSLMSR